MDDDEFENLLNKIKAGLIATYGVDPDLAAGAVHEAYISIHYRGIEHIEPKAFSHYWYIASRNKLFDAIKDRDKYDLVENEYYLQQAGHIDDTDISLQIDQYHKDAKLYWQVMSLIVKLNRRYRVAFVERYIWRKEYREIADLLDVSEGNARVITTRAKKQLLKLHTQTTES